MDSLLSVLWRASWQGALAISVVWLLCRPIFKIDPRVQSWLWRLVYIRLLVSLLWWPAIELPLLPPSTPVLVSSPENDGLLVGTDNRIFAAAGNAGLGRAAAIGLIGIWLAGILWSLWRLYVEARATRALRGRCRDVQDSEIVSDYQSLSDRLGVANPPLLLESGELFAPLLISCGPAAIVIPATFSVDYSPQQQRMILAHELTHFKRADLRWSWVARLARCVFFFHPFVWLADHEWQQSQEMACDREVLRLELDSLSSYGAMLLRVVQQPGASLGLAAMRVAESYSSVRRRLLAMNQSVKMSRRGVVLTGATVLAAGAIAFIPWRVVAQEPAKNAGYAIKHDGGEGISFLNPKLLKDLQLTNSQIARIKSIHESALRQVRGTLTRQQAADLDKMLAASHAEKVHMSLTPEQMQKLEAIKRHMGEEAHAIESDASLTPAQKEERMRVLKEHHEIIFNQILTPDQREEAHRAIELKQDVSAFPQLSDDQARQMSDLKRHIGEMAHQIESDTSGNPQDKKERMEELERAMHDGMRRILTPEQIQQLEQSHAAHSEGLFSAAGLSKLGLTPAQNRRIEAIHKSAQSQFLSTLTPAQRARLQQMHGE